MIGEMLAAMGMSATSWFDMLLPFLDFVNNYLGGGALKERMIV